MPPGAQAWFAIGLSLVGGVLLVYWLVCTYILLRGGNPEDLHKR